MHCTEVIPDDSIAKVNSLWNSPFLCTIIVQRLMIWKSSWALRRIIASAVSAVLCAPYFSRLYFPREGDTFWCTAFWWGKKITFGTRYFGTAERRISGGIPNGIASADSSPCGKKPARMFFRKASTLQLILVDVELKAFASAVRGKRVKVSVKRGNDRIRII